MIECCVLLALLGLLGRKPVLGDRHEGGAVEPVDGRRHVAIDVDPLGDKLAFVMLSGERRIGKNGVLSSGYGIGAEGFYRRFCRHVEGGRELAARIVGVCRHQWAPAVPRLWRDLELTARRAMQRPGQPAVARCGVVYQLVTRVGLPCLICVLSNGKLLHYANARIDGADKWAGCAGSTTPTAG